MITHDLKLTIQSGPLAGTSLDVPVTRFSIGRDPACDLQLDDPKVSRFHCFLVPSQGRLTLEDNNSTNGVLVNGRRVASATLQTGDLIKIGRTEMALMEPRDFQTIQFYDSDQSPVIAELRSDSVSSDALADKFAQIFDYYKDHQPAVSDVERVELVKTQRLVNSLKSLYSVTGQMSRLLPLPKLLAMLTDALFDVFAGAENVVILLKDADSGSFIPRHAACREKGPLPAISISRTALNRAIESRTTIVANDLPGDSRFNHAESIMGFHMKAFICAPLIIGEDILGAVYLDNRQKSVAYDEMDAELVTAFANQAAIAIDNARLCDDLQESYHQMLQALVTAIEAKDPYTRGHSQRVKRYAQGLARHLGFERDRLERLGMAAELHDIGKIGVREGIINKRGDLTDTEYQSIKMHVEMGEKILRPIVYLRDLLPWIRGHHERWDGSGYPDGLKEEECPMEARVLGVADAFDAMTSQRAYNKPITKDEAVERLRTDSGTKFDPTVVSAMEQHLAEPGAWQIPDATSVPGVPSLPEQTVR